MTLLDWYGLKRLAAGLVVAVFVWATPAITRAADEGPAAGPGENSPAATDTDKPAEEKQEAPRLQIQDEGPPAGSERVRQPRLQLTQPSSDAVERPYWKNWVFWTVAGAAVAGAVVTLLYMSAGTSDVAPCPVDIAGALGCYGAGR